MMMIKSVLALLLGSCLLISCGERSAISERLAGSDSLVITFNYAGTDSVTASVSTTETNAIAKLARFMGGREIPKPGCGYGGNMRFFKGGQEVMPVVFHLQKDCRYFMYELDNKLLYTSMPDEAVDFLNSLAEGKNWY